MRKRLRKKKRIGEFRELGFHVGLKFSSGMDSTSQDDLIDRFIEEAIENNELMFGGGGFEGEFSGFVTADSSRGSVTEGQREAVQKWLTTDDSISGYYVSSLMDAWHGRLEEDLDWIEK